MDLTYISLEKKDRVAIAWLNKPKANTYDADLMRDLNTMIDDVRFDDDVDVCVIASKLDGVWSAGADINLLASSTPDYKAMFCLNCQEILNKMESTPKLFIAAIDGHCVGGGLEIAMATYLRVASDGAWRVGLPEVTLGVLPGTGGTQRLPRLVGKSRAIDLMATGRMITPKEALEWGLFNRVFPRAKFWDETMAFAKGLTYPEHAAQAVGHGRRRDADVRRLRPRTRVAESPLRDGRCEGGLPRVPREAKASLPREVTFGIAAGDVGPEGGWSISGLRSLASGSLGSRISMRWRRCGRSSRTTTPIWVDRSITSRPDGRETGGASHAATSGIGTAFASSPNSTGRRWASSWERSSHGQGSSSTDRTDTSTT